MIVGTAGHIDHGKTTLVKALTGVDTDRLPEEKQRGVTIELGYAFLDVPGGGGGRIGFIDVPGHERLVHTMLAGATGIDFALLLVAADDGVMPQTREHLAVLSLLGIARGAVVVTKADRADAARTAAVAAEAAALLVGTPLEGAPVLPVSAISGEGLPALQGLLWAAAKATGQRSSRDAAFRLAVDRVFTLGGVGTVATGTVHAGEVAIGDELCIVPGNRRARARSLHAHNRAAGRAGAGVRCAVALAGVAKDEIARGQWLVTPAAALQATRIDATLTLWHAEPRALRSGTPVHVHIGSATTLASVAVLDGGDSLAPGATAAVQLVLREPLGAWWGDRVVLRDASASRTIAGGIVLDPHAPARYRRTPQRAAELAALALPAAAQRVAALLEAAPHGIDLRRLACAAGQSATHRPRGDGLPAGTLQEAGSDGDATHWALGPRQAAQARAAVLAALERFHAQHADDPGPDGARLRRLALPRLPEALWRALLESLLAEGSVVRSGGGAFVSLPAHGVRLSASEQRIAQKVAPLLADGSFEGHWVRDLARDAQESEPLMRTTLARLAQRGELHQVVKDLYYAGATIARLAAIARNVSAARGETVSAADFRDATQLGRKRAIQVLEYFDRIGLLRRVGDLHRVRSDTRLFAADAGLAR